VDVALAVAASAAYPIVLRAVDRTWRFRRKGREETRRVLLTDGGVYDNLGVQAIESGRSADFSLHCFPCKYIIACNAGMGQETGDKLPRWWYPQVKQSFGIIHGRVQDGSMHSLHQMREAGLIEGFALPYLGQQDEQLPWRPAGLVPRQEVMRYPTNFAPMSDSWIDRISTRGEQLTRVILSIHVSPLLQQ
jgi:NTE family protein